MLSLKNFDIEDQGNFTVDCTGQYCILTWSEYLPGGLQGRTLRFSARFSGYNTGDETVNAFYYFQGYPGNYASSLVKLFPTHILVEDASLSDLIATGVPQKIVVKGNFLIDTDYTFSSQDNYDLIFTPESSLKVSGHT